MKRIFVALTMVVGCRDSSAPSLANGYLLAAIDGKSLPTVPIGWPAGRAVEGASLNFGPRPQLNDGAQGTVTYTVTVAGHLTATEHQFLVRAGILHIDLCPIGAVCIAIPMEFVGPIEPGRLTLTYSVGGTGMASSVYRFEVPRTD